MILLWPVVNAFAQSQPVPRSLTIGDTVPGIIFSNTLQYKYPSMHLSDFRGKLVILDFWSSWCHSCIALFPHLDSLQREFSDQIQIILVNTKSKATGDDKDKISKILNRVKNKTSSPLDLPVVFDAPELDTYFPCKIIPHEVWISPHGKVIAITPGDEVNRKNIRAMLTGSKIMLPLKKDNIDFDKKIGLFINGNGGNGEQLLFRSILSGNVEGIGGGKGLLTKEGKTIGRYNYNATLPDLIKNAYSDVITTHNNRLIIQLNDPNSLYCYELSVPPTDETAIQTFMQQDLKRYFNISVQKQCRATKCLVLAIDPSKKLQQQNGNPRSAMVKETSGKHMYNYEPSLIVNQLNRYSPIPIIDETNTRIKISVDLPSHVADIEGLKKAFQKSGLVLTEQTRVIEMILITDK